MHNKQTKIQNRKPSKQLHLPQVLKILDILYGASSYVKVFIILNMFYFFCLSRLILTSLRLRGVNLPPQRPLDYVDGVNFMTASSFLRNLCSWTLTTSISTGVLIFSKTVCYCCWRWRHPATISRMHHWAFIALLKKPAIASVTIWGLFSPNCRHPSPFPSTRLQTSSEKEGVFSKKYLKLNFSYYAS